MTSIENIEGGMGNDFIIGDTLANELSGLEGNDNITGGGGADTLRGDDGSDVFKYLSVADSGIGAGNRDVIEDFEGDVDTFDFSGLVGSSGGNGTFSYLGDSSNAFTANGNTQARFDANTKILEIDANGDATADMEIEMNNVDTANLDLDNFTI